MNIHILFGLRSDLLKTFQKALTIVTPFLSFKGITHAYLLKILITHNKNLIPLLNVLINWISARLAPASLVFTWWINSCFLKCFDNWFIKFICNLLILFNLIFNSTTWNRFICKWSVFFIKKTVNHRSKNSLISTIFWIFCNIKWIIS